MIFYAVRPAEKGFEAVFVGYGVGRVTKFIPLAIRGIVQFTRADKNTVHDEARKLVESTGWKGKIFNFDSDPGRHICRFGFDPWSFLPSDHTHQIKLESLKSD
jgi:hypothetical protein